MSEIERLAEEYRNASSASREAEARSEAACEAWQQAMTERGEAWEAEQAAKQALLDASRREFKEQMTRA